MAPRGKHSKEHSKIAWRELCWRRGQRASGEGSHFAGIAREFIAMRERRERERRGVVVKGKTHNARATAQA
jgi:hypothetical protein